MSASFLQLTTGYRRRLRAPPPNRGDWMQTYTGRAYFPTDPRPEEVHLEDIVHGLSMQCRYGGQCEEFYSVLEHSYWLSFIVSAQYAFKALVHDFSEGYLIDIPRPAKVAMPDYQRIEKMNWLAICKHFGWNPELPKEVHDADSGICFSERDQNMKTPPYLWKTADPGYRIKIQCWSPRRARKMFMRRWKELTGQHLTLWDRITLRFYNKKLLKETSNASDRYSRTGPVW